jgi:hypothetical protein
MARLQGDLRRVEQLLARFDREVRDAFIAAIVAARQSIDLRALEAALQARDVRRAVELLTIRQGLLFPLDQALTAIYAAGGGSIAAGIPISAGVLAFDGRAIRAELWARNHVGNLIREILADQVAMTRAVIEAQLALGRGPRAIITDLVGRVTSRGRQGGFIGLTERQASYAIRARAELAALDRAYFSRALRDRRFDGLVERAIAQGRPLAAADLDRIVGRYRDRLLAHRAETIARTESITALRAGRAEGIRQATEQGIIDPTRVKRVWDATGDKRTRPDHMAMNGTAVDGLDAPHVLPDGSRMMYPGDTDLGADPSQTINCRCVERFQIDWLRAR